MRAPLSWLRDFAPFPDDIGALRAALDDLGLVVEAIEHVGEGLGDVVVEPGDRDPPDRGRRPIRLVVVDGGGGAARDRVRRVQLRGGGPGPAGAGRARSCPAGFEIARRKMRGVVSNGMLCSGKELGLSDDGAGLLVLGDEVAGRARARRSWRRSGCEPDVVFDITVEGNRPDAWCIAGIARDLAGRLGLPFAAARAARAARRAAGRSRRRRRASVESTRPLPPPHGDGARPTSPSARRRAGSPERLLLAGMRPINNVVDASNYVMLELGQPTHPYDLARLPGRGLIVRRARPGETVETLDGVERTVGRAGPEPR